MQNQVRKKDKFRTAVSLSNPGWKPNLPAPSCTWSRGLIVNSVSLTVVVKWNMRSLRSKNLLPVTAKFFTSRALPSSPTFGVVNVFSPALWVAGCVEFPGSGSFRDQTRITQIGGFPSTFRKPQLVWSSKDHKAFGEWFIFGFHSGSFLAGIINATLTLSHKIIMVCSVANVNVLDTFVPIVGWRDAHNWALHLEGSKECPISARFGAKN